MSFKLQSDITIGDYELTGGVNEVKIKRSVKEIVDSATLKIPAIGQVFTQNTSDLPSTSIETSKLWNEGDKVTIQLGYNGDLRTEFMGFVRRITAAVPVEMHCEGYAWQLRRKAFTGTWNSILLRDFLVQLVAGTDVLLHPLIPTLPLVNLCIREGNALSALEYMKKHMHLSVYFQFNVLYVGEEETVPGNTVNFRLGWNCIRDNNLKYRNSLDEQVFIRLATGKGKLLKRVLVETGSKGGSVVNENISHITDATALNNIANQILLNHNYTGYEGYISGLLQPYCQPSDTATVIDQLYQVMGGSFFVEGVEVDFTTSGATRKTHIGRTVGL